MGTKNAKSITGNINIYNNGLLINMTERMKNILIAYQNGDITKEEYLKYVVK